MNGYILYFSVLFYGIYNSINIETTKNQLMLSVFFIAITWYYILTWMDKEIRDYDDNTDVFDKAYHQVSNESNNWFWSYQLLALVPIWVLTIPISQYHVILMGFFGAISGSMSLWLPKDLPKIGLNWLTYLALLSVYAVLPAMKHYAQNDDNNGDDNYITFGWITWYLHAILMLLPFINMINIEPINNLWLHPIALIIMIQHWFCLWSIESPYLFDTDNKCATSISIDAIGSTMLICYLMSDKSVSSIIHYLVKSILISPGATLALELATQ